jgi:predicted acetyltransferase
MQGITLTGQLEIATVFLTLARKAAASSTIINAGNGNFEVASKFNMRGTNYRCNKSRR